MSVLPPAPDPPEAPPKTLATTSLPRRVRRVLEHILSLASDELERQLALTMSDLEQQLFRMSEQARNSALQGGYMQTLHTLRTNRSDLMPRFMSGLEASLASVDWRSKRPTAEDSAPSAFKHLSLVEEKDMDEDLVLYRIAVRQEARASLTLHLLGQRFGVLAGAPAFDNERLPLGPRALCRVMRDASQCLHLPMESRLLLYNLFDNRVMGPYPQMLEMLNASIAADGILPSLTYVPLRTRPTLQGEAEAAADAATGTARKRRRDKASPQVDGEAVSAPGPAAAGTPETPATSARVTPPARRSDIRGRRKSDAEPTFTKWLGQADATPTKADESAAFELLQQLLSGRRELIGKLKPERRTSPREELQTTEVLNALGSMQATGLSGETRNLVDIRQALLAQMRLQRGHGTALSARDSDTFELLEMLYTQLNRDVRPDTPAVPLLRKLQLPLLRLALQDRAFFIRSQHPARQLLNAVAESGASWLGEDDVDPQMALPLLRAVDHVVKHFDDDPTVFETSNHDLQMQLQVLARKAENTERRHVEAARGKEKLEIAKAQAAETITGIVRDVKLPKFARALLNQAWADVLTLTLLRQGRDSETWTRQLDVTRRIVSSCGPGGEPDPELSSHIEASLVQVGYHAEEAAAIASRLTGALDDDDNDQASRTELTMRIKARVRLGEDTVEKSKPKLPERTPAEQEQHDRLRVMPYGTWVEFVTNQQGDVVRRRMSWYSPMTDNALFVNQRGRRVSEQSLDSVARMLANGQARIVPAESGRLIDRAWQATINTLRTFAGRGDEAQPGDAEVTS